MGWWRNLTTSHLSLISASNIKKKRQVREEHNNFKFSEGQAKWRYWTLRRHYRSVNFKDSCKKWLSELNKIFKRSFKKIFVLFDFHHFIWIFNNMSGLYSVYFNTQMSSSKICHRNQIHQQGEGDWVLVAIQAKIRANTEAKEGS